MKLLKNQGSERVIDELRASLTAGGSLDAASPDLSLFAYGELREALRLLSSCRLILPFAQTNAQSLLGSDLDRGYRNQLSAHQLARHFAVWLRQAVEVKAAPGPLPQATLVAKTAGGTPSRVISGNCPLTTDGLGITPGNQFSLVQATETPEESQLLAAWFTQLWSALPASAGGKEALLAQLSELTARREPSLIYALTLYHLFKDRGDELDEDKIVKSATGIRNTVVWKKLFKFQRDGVVGAIDKLERLGGCIIADSGGLGKTFEALAIIKYYELRNDRVLVLVPKRLRDNWTLYKANDRRNFLAPDRFNYDVLNHTDLSRDGGKSGDIELSHVNWGNYDLVVIDESHNFRNKATHKDRETRYDRLMRRIIKEGVKTRVLMLSATPVNNRLADLKNQIAFVTEGDDTALFDQGIASIEATVRKAQLQFNRWLASEEVDRTPPRLIEMLGFDYFKLLDLLTIARSRRHIEKYYGTAETGKFPERLKPINYKPDVDRAGEFSSIRDINNEIRRLTLSVTGADGRPAPLGFDQSKVLWEHLKAAGLVNAQGKVQDALRKALKDGTLTLPEPFAAQLPEVKEILRKLAGRLEIKNADECKQVKTRQAVLQGADFKALWDRIKHKTTYRVQFDNEALLVACIRALKDAPPIAKTRLQWRKADLAIGKAGVEATETATSAPVTLDEGDIELPDILTDLQDKTQLTRRSIHRILVESGRLDDFKRNPQQFIELAAEIINRCKRVALMDGIKYQRIGAEDYYAQELFETEELSGYLKSMIDANKSVHEQVVYQSDTERTFAEQLEKNEAIKVYAKLPGWFRVPTPLGPYNPDWAVLVEKDGTERLYFVVETKSSLFTDDLRDKESAKIQCGEAHFAELAKYSSPAAQFLKATKLDDVLAQC